MIKINKVYFANRKEYENGFGYSYKILPTYTSNGKTKKDGYYVMKTYRRSLKGEAVFSGTLAECRQYIITELGTDDPPHAW